MIETDKYFIMETNIKQYRYIIFSKGSNILNDFEEVATHFKNTKHDNTGKALFDQLALTGVNNNRFIEMQYEKGKFAIGSINVRDKIKNKRAIKKINNFYKEHINLIDNCSAMSTLDKVLLKDELSK
jgi:hypothetical protein